MKTGNLAISDQSNHEPHINVGGDELTLRVTSDQSDGAILAFDVRIPAGGGPPLLHRHGAFEIYRVERGELAFYLEDEHGDVQRAVVHSGAVVAIPGGREHTVRNESAAEARAFVMFAPGSEMQCFVRAAGELGADGAPEIEDVLALADAHRVTITRPLSRVA